MPRACDSCGKRYEPLRAASRYCSGACRTRAHRAGIARPAVARPEKPQRHAPAASGNLTAAVLEELRVASKETTALGQACLAVAQRIDHAQLESGSALAAMTREFRAALEAALAVKADNGDVLDEMARKRQERLSRAGA
jgi:hypothetical protein